MLISLGKLGPEIAARAPCVASDESGRVPSASRRRGSIAEERALRGSPAARGGGGGAGAPFGR